MDEEKDKTAPQDVTDGEESQEHLEEKETQEEQSEQTTDTENDETVEIKAENEAENDAEEKAEKPASRRENLRIQKLIQKLREKDAPAPKPQNTHQGLDYRQTLDADDEVYKQLESDRQKYGENLYNQGLEQAKSIQFHTRLEIDAPKVMSKYPQFNPESEKFNPVAANAINEWYLANVGFNPQTGSVKNADVRYAEFVDGIMELADEMAGHKVATTTKNIAKQAASTGIRPNGSTAKSLNLNQAPEAMSDDELEALISAAIPPKKR